jgi:secondary thiamine-phosphate synthase enzyme
MDGTELRVRTGDRLVTGITDEIAAWCVGRGDGLCHVFAPHATAGIALIETGSGTEQDLSSTIARLLPREDIYRHRHGSTGHGADHVLPAFVSPSLVLAVRGGRLQLGTWQSVVLVDPNGDNTERRVWLSWLGGGG